MPKTRFKQTQPPQIRIVGKNDISFFEPPRYMYVTFHLTDGKKISCRARLGDFEGQLAESSFLRCHQSFCINLEKVTSLKKNSFVIGQTEIPISRAYLKNARQKYKDYLAQQKVCS